MDTKNIQAKKIIETIMSNQLKSGVNPSDATVNYLFRKITEDKSLGMPLTEFKEIEKRERSDSKSYNRLLDDIDFDLNTLFESISSQNKDMINSFSIQEDEKVKLLAKIKALKNRIDKLLTVSEQNNNFQYSLSENFSSFEGIDLNESDVFIDLEEKKAQLPISKKDLLKVPMLNASISINKISPEKRAYTKELNSIKYAIDDYLNTFWAYRVNYPKGDEPEVPVRVELEIELDDYYTVSEAQIVPKSSGNMEAEIFFDKNNSWVSMSNNNSKALNNKNVWAIFPEPQKTKKIKIILSKEKADFQENEISYIFGLKNISLNYKEYKTNAKVTTKELKINKNNLNETIESLELETEDEIPSETDIKYFVQIKNNNNLFRDPDFEDTNSVNFWGIPVNYWGAENYYDVGGVDGGSYFGDKSVHGMRQTVDLVSGRTYTISGYVRAVASKEPVMVAMKHNKDVQRVINIEQDGQWTYFEETFVNNTNGDNDVIIKDSQSEIHEVHADKFSLVEGTKAGAVDYSNPYNISPANRNNPRYKQELKLNNILTAEDFFPTADLTTGDVKHGKTFYERDLAERPIKKELSLYQGVERWEVQSYDRLMPEGTKAGLYLWSKQKKQDFSKENNMFKPHNIDFDNRYAESINPSATAGKHYLYSTWVYLKNPESMLVDNLNYAKCYDNEAVYVNGKKLEKQVVGDTYSYNIQFKSGWNKIDVVIYMPVGTASTDNTYFQNIIDLSTFDKWRAKKEKMDEVSLSSLYSGYDYEDDSVFAIKDTKIVLNNQEGVSGNNYFAEYKFTTNNIDSIRIMAELYSTNTYLTPKIDKMKANIKY